MKKFIAMLALLTASATAQADATYTYAQATNQWAYAGVTTGSTAKGFGEIGVQYGKGLISNFVGKEFYTLATEGEVLRINTTNFLTVGPAFRISLTTLNLNDTVLKTKMAYVAGGKWQASFAGETAILNGAVLTYGVTKITTADPTFQTGITFLF